MKYKAAIFDLDGVIVDTARLHYIAWKKTASQLGIDFTAEQNENLKGISRMAAMDYLIHLSGKPVEEDERLRLAEKKNEYYKLLTESLTPGDCLPGALKCIQYLKSIGIFIALGSASKNAVHVLERLKIITLFDAIIDGTKVEHAKPDPEVFLLGARQLGIAPEQCVVFEDAVSGIQAAKNGGMYAVGVGDPCILKQADLVVQQLDNDEVFRLFT